MESAFLASPEAALKHFEVSEQNGLSSAQVNTARSKYGPNGTSELDSFTDAVIDPSAALREDPPTPLWQLVLEQFKDQLVIILLGSAAVSFVLALFEEGEGWTAFVDPIVVSRSPSPLAAHAH